MRSDSRGRDTQLNKKSAVVSFGSSELEYMFADYINLQEMIAWAEALKNKNSPISVIVGTKYKDCYYICYERNNKFTFRELDVSPFVCWRKSAAKNLRSMKNEIRNSDFLFPEWIDGLYLEDFNFIDRYNEDIVIDVGIANWQYYYESGLGPSEAVAEDMRGMF